MRLSANDRVVRAVEIDPDQIVLEDVVLDAGAIGAAIDEDARVLVDQA